MLAPYISLWVFVILMVGTPGPANMLAMSAGASYGFRATIPFLGGLLIGKLLVNGLLAFGFGAVLIEMPMLAAMLSYISAGYLCYLALLGWHSGTAKGANKSRLGFLSGVIVHPLNPKAWLMATLAYSQFISGFDSDFERYALAPLSFFVAQFVFHALWCWAGALLKSQLGRNLVINRSLIVLTILVVIWALMQ